MTILLPPFHFCCLYKDLAMQSSHLWQVVAEKIPKKYSYRWQPGAFKLASFLPLVLSSNKCPVYLFAYVKAKKII